MSSFGSFNVPEGTFPVPAPLSLDVYDRDVDAMRADFRRHHRVPRPWILAVGIAEQQPVAPG